MNKRKNDLLRILGIILTLSGLAGIVRPLVSSLFHAPIIFAFFGIIPDGLWALIAWIVIVVVGIIFISITKVITDDAGNTH